MENHNTPETGIDYETAYQVQCTLVGELNDIYVLVETARQAVAHVDADETDPAEQVLMMASNRLYDLVQVETARGVELERLAEKQREGGA